MTVPDDPGRLAEREASLAETLKFALASLSRLDACPAEPRAEVASRVQQLERELDTVRAAIAASQPACPARLNARRSGPVRPPDDGESR